MPISRYGIEESTSVAMLTEPGYTRRLSSSLKVVCFTGLEVTVRQSGKKRAAGKLSRQCSPLRGRAFELAQVAQGDGSRCHDLKANSGSGQIGPVYDHSPPANLPADNP
jgi:transposase